MNDPTPALTSGTATLGQAHTVSTLRERKRRVARWVRRGLLMAAVLAAIGGAVLALRPRPVSVELAVAKLGSLEVTVEETGVARMHDHYVVSAPTAGTLARITLEVGDSVEEGQTIAEIAPLTAPLLDPRARAEGEARLGAALSAEQQARAQVGRASAAQELAEQELVRTRQLRAGGAVTEQTLDRAAFEARLRNEELRSAAFGQKVASEEVRRARAVLAAGRGTERHVDVVAPVSGRVLRIQQKSAGVVPAGAPLLEIADPAALEVVVDLLTPDAVRIHPGTKVVVGGWGGEPLEGRVHRIEPAAFTRVSALGVDEQRVNVIVALVSPRARWQALGDGFRVEARLVLAELDRALTLPQGAVFRSGAGWAVFRVDREGIARMVPVEVGQRAQALVEVRSGLAAGDRVVVHPGDKVGDGVRVQGRE